MTNYTAKLFENARKTIQRPKLTYLLSDDLPSVCWDGGIIALLHQVSLSSVSNWELRTLKLFKVELFGILA